MLGDEALVVVLSQQLAGVPMNAGYDRMAGPHQALERSAFLCIEATHPMSRGSRQGTLYLCDTDRPELARRAARRNLPNPTAPRGP